MELLIHEDWQPNRIPISPYSEKPEGSCCGCLCCYFPSLVLTVLPACSYLILWLPYLFSDFIFSYYVLIVELMLPTSGSSNAGSNVEENGGNIDQKTSTRGE